MQGHDPRLRRQRGGAGVAAQADGRTAGPTVWLSCFASAHPEAQENLSFLYPCTCCLLLSPLAARQASVSPSMLEPVCAGRRGWQ